jgi:hypothetical protein
MRSRWLVLVALVTVLGVARAQSFQEITLSPRPDGSYVGLAGFGHLAPAGFSDAVVFSAPIDGALSLELAFHTMPGVPESANFFQHVDIDGAGGPVFGSHASVGPLRIAAGRPRIDIIGAATIPHGVPVPVQPVGAYSVEIMLAAITPAVPEPRIWVLLLSGLAAGAYLARRAPRS